ncbi:MAG: tetratricopeptide repeat protein [Burkholderiales bacterium]
MRTDGATADLVRRALASLRAGNASEAERLCREALAHDAQCAGALRLLAGIAQRSGRIEDALPLADAAVAADPQNVEGHLVQASLRNAAGRFADAAQSAARGLALRPDMPEALVLHGLALHRLGQQAEALADYERALAARADYLPALVNRAAALKDLERFADALAGYDAVLARVPGQPEALTNRAAVLTELGRYAEALASAERATTLMPHYYEAWHNRGVALVALQRYDEAIECYTRAVGAAADFAPSYQGRASALGHLRLYELALADYEAACRLDPTLPFVEGSVMHAKLHCARWEGFAAAQAQLAAHVREGRRACEPLSFVAVGESAADQLACGRTWNERHYPARAPLWRGERYAHERIRVAYLSADFHDHATAYLMAEVFERHDRARFETLAVSWGPATGTPLRKRLEAAFDTFIDVRERTDDDIARLLRERAIDIAVDLKGYTFEARLGILAQRPAPVQVTHLGFPGSLGAPYIDYFIADETVVPAAARAHYSEQVMWLPGSYQPNDRQRVIDDDTPPRRGHGLPEHGFVFCSFNNTYKIVPAQFDAWMRLLRAVEGSVLWLLEGNTTAPANLRREAEARGVAGERLVFAPRMPLAAHLARHRHADLFLDTLPCNAHTTASDALWAGLPVLTCLGGTFAGRVAGSLVRAAGLPELVVDTMAEYEAVALALAREPARLATLRGRLHDQRMTCALFDSERYTRHLESAYAKMVERSRAGLPPMAFAVPDA